jgi:hypothetical protein
MGQDNKSVEARRQNDRAGSNRRTGLTRVNQAALLDFSIAAYPKKNEMVV